MNKSDKQLQNPSPDKVEPHELAQSPTLSEEKLNNTTPPKESEKTSLFRLFLIMFKIGLFTFGGGYAMIPLLENEFVSKRKFLSHDDFMNMLAIAESTPGPIAINSATYIGYKQGKILGSIVCTLGVVLPSFTIIFILSLFFDNLLQYRIVSAAFRGIQVAVIYLILVAGLKMLKKIEKNFLNFFILAVVIILFVIFSIFAINFSSIFFILLSALVGLSFYLIKTISSKKREVKK